jgi:DNA-binding CsgD family transcriptional regulator
MATATSSVPESTEQLRRIAIAVDDCDVEPIPAQELPLSPLSVWEGILSGVWSIEDSFETGGRWFLIARRRADCEARAALTERERQVLTLALRGLSNKVTALELGLTNSTVATHLRRGLLKTGAHSRLTLLRAFGGLSEFTDSRVVQMTIAEPGNRIDNGEASVLPEACLLAV